MKQAIETKQDITPTLKKQWTPAQLKIVETAIFNYFKRAFHETMHDVNIGQARSFGQINNALGLTYTSTSSFAMLSICNTEVYFDYGKQWHFVCFGLAEGNSGFVYALIHDAEENEIYFPIN